MGYWDPLPQRLTGIFYLAQLDSQQECLMNMYLSFITSISTTAQIHWRCLWLMTKFLYIMGELCW